MFVDEDIIEQAKQYICRWDEVPSGYESVWVILLCGIIHALCIEKVMNGGERQTLSIEKE